MPTRTKLPLLLSALVLATLLALPAVAQATLSYVRNPLAPTVFVADDDGSGARKLDRGESPHVSPDGNWVAYLHQGAKNAQELKLAPAAGGQARTLMVGWREPFSLAWSPDSTRIAALRGPELGKRKLVVIDIATGAQNVIAIGYFSGFSFAPEGGPLVFAKSGSERFPPRSDVYRIDLLPPGAVSVAPVLPQKITGDHRSSYPLWGPGNRIVFVKTLEAKKRKYGPKNELYLMDPAGKGVKRLTHTKVPPLLQGLFPTDWSANGSRLLAEFEGQDTSYAVAVNPKNGKQRAVAESGEAGFVGTALSADGKEILGYTGGFDPSSQHNVESVPYSNGRVKVLAKNAFSPSWSR
jgi:Tol biopolymer transport system component